MTEWSFDRWSRTLTMNKALCSKTGNGAFPSPTMLIQVGTAKLQSECGLGYRAKTLIQLAEQVMPQPLHGAGTRHGCCIKRQRFVQFWHGTGSEHIQPGVVLPNDLPYYSALVAAKCSALVSTCIAYEACTSCIFEPGVDIRLAVKWPQKLCGRARNLTSFMRMQVVSGEADIDGLETPGLSSEEVYQRLLPLPGLDPDPSTAWFAARHISSAAVRMQWRNQACANQSQCRADTVTHRCTFLHTFSHSALLMVCT